MRAIDFFCGGGGMTNGLIQSGIEVIAGVDLDSDAQATYEANNNGARFINEDITKLSLDFFEKKFGVQRNDDEMIFVGCSHCQFYSIIRSSKEKSRKTKDLLLYFEKFVDYYRPGYILVENVPGIMSNRETILNDFLEKIETLGYGNRENGRCDYSIVNMRNYSIPQNRRRFSLIATRLDRQVHLPEHDEHIVTVREAIGDETFYPRIPAGFHDDNLQRYHSTRSLTPINMERIQTVPHDGGTRIAFRDNPDLQLNCYINRDNSFRDVYGRLFWDKPSSTITTKFLSFTNGRFGHPEQDRCISVREGATLQSFPYDYQFLTNSIQKAARLIGNAVPPEYGRRLGEVLQAVNNG